MRLLLTAGYDRARHAVALAELVTRRGHEVAAVLVVSPWQWRRVRSFVRQRGARALRGAVHKLFGRSEAGGSDPLTELLAREGVAHRSLSAWARDRGVPLVRVEGLSGALAVETAREARVDGALYAGGGILRAPFLDAVNGRVLNAHAGPLPRIRGMNACEWSVLLGVAPKVTVHFIDRGIDTGAVVDEIPVPVQPTDTLDDLRGRTVALGVEGLVRSVEAIAAPLPESPEGADAERQCFVLAPALRELAERRLGAAGREAAR